MAVHNNHFGLLVELLALGSRDGDCQLEVGITRRDGCTRHILSIDEHTYLQIAALVPLSGHKVRLSLYMKWDPFRHTYFSSLVRMRDTFSETLYFNCSESYGEQLRALMEQEDSPSRQAARQEAGENVRNISVPSVHKRAALSGLKYKQTVLLRGLLFGFVLALLLLRMDGGETWLFANSAEAKEDSAKTDRASASVPAGDTRRAAGTGSAAAALNTDSDSMHRLAGIPNPTDSAGLQLPANQSQPARSAPAQADPAAQPQPLYETFELSGDSYEYSLPEGYVALSFDDGPSPYTEQLVDILAKEGVAANFLFIGRNVSRYPGAVRYAGEHGMPVGNHSWDHSDMTANSPEENRSNLEQANRSLEQLVTAPVTIFRPPYGAVNRALAEEAGRQQLKVLLWNRDPEDWKAGSKEAILDYFYRTDPSGGIYLLHEKQITVQALPEIIDFLKGRGLKFAVFK
ncbi:Peptidoglycan-N-acetylglucosamine deacetylase [compost metagenome]